MGAEQFVTKSNSRFPDAQEAFNQAKEQEAYEHGHGGYSGTLAEKGDYVMIPVPDEMEAGNFVDHVLSYYKVDWGENKGEEHWLGNAEPDGLEQSSREAIRKAHDLVDDKWGPAGCVKDADHGFIFFGWASS